jgi:hypothetical protein
MEQLIAVSSPVLDLIVYADTLLVPSFATYANVPEGSTVIEFADANVPAFPSGNGEPLIAFIFPLLALMAYAETVLAMVLEP